MAGSSFKKAVIRQQEAQFIARTSELDWFRANLGLDADSPDRRFIFCIHGDGGVGKSSLLRRLRSIADGYGALTGWVDEQSSGCRRRCGASRPT
jgi:putative ribosome biogenesis GTPase RsgA